MSAPTPTTSRRVSPDAGLRRLARVALTLVVRGRRERGGPWGEAVLAELGQTRGRWDTVRWAVGGARAALRERRMQRRELPRRLRLQRRAIVTVVTGVLVTAAVQQWALTPMYEPSAAMAPTLRTADYWLMDRVGFRVTGLRLGDVVAFRQAVDGGSAFTAVRRVVGLSGDAMSCRDGRLVRNGTAVPDPHPGAGLGTATDACVPLTVPAGAVYLLGDNRGVAGEWNPVALDRVEGRLVTRLWNAGQDPWWAPPASVAG